MSEMTIQVEKRERGGKNVNRRLRASGHVPAVVYGGGKEPVPIQLPRRELLDQLRATGADNAVFLLKLPGGSGERHAMIRDMQVDPVSHEILHIDFLRVLMTEAVRVSVAIELEGTPEGVKNEGGMLDFITREVEVECLPGDIPSHLTIDVSGLHVGEHVEAEDLVIPKGVKLVSATDLVIASVAHRRIAAVEEEEIEEEALLEAEREEPEVIGRGKEEGEEEQEGEG